ncbi:MAG: lysophospholipid acyltransferase family protein [Gammaproteobacteria bacterium]|nr:lysophospholipid acyltransferase family protein [Gammaproteobacteria bacterium]
MFIYKALSRLPFNTLYFLSDISCFILFHLARYRRSISYNNLRRSFPNKTTKQITAIQKSAYQHLTDTLLEAIKANTISNTEVESRVTLLGFEEIQNLVQNGQSVFMLTAHTAPVEWVSFAAHLKYGFAIDPVYKPIHSKALDKFIFTMRSRHQSTPIPYKKLAKDVVLRKSANRSIAMLADLEPRSRDQSLKVDFLNQTTRFFLGSEKIIKLSGLPTFFIAIEKTTRGHYQATAKNLSLNPKILDANILTKKYINCVEELVSNNPASWLWTHKRWKHATT